MSIWYFLFLCMGTMTALTLFLLASAASFNRDVAPMIMFLIAASVMLTLTIVLAP